MRQLLFQNYDREEQAGTPQAIVNWVNAILNGKHEPCVSYLRLSIEGYN